MLNLTVVALQASQWQQTRRAASGAGIPGTVKLNTRLTAVMQAQPDIWLWQAVQGSFSELSCHVMRRPADHPPHSSGGNDGDAHAAQLQQLGPLFHEEEAALLASAGSSGDVSMLPLPGRPQVRNDHASRCWAPARQTIRKLLFCQEPFALL